MACGVGTELSQANRALRNVSAEFLTKSHPYRPDSAVLWQAQTSLPHLSPPSAELLLFGVAEQGRGESRHPPTTLRKASKAGRSFRSSAGSFCTCRASTKAQAQLEDTGSPETSGSWRHSSNRAEERQADSKHALHQQDSGRLSAFTLLPNLRPQ